MRPNGISGSLTAAGQLDGRTIEGFQLRAAPPAAIQTTRLRTDWLYTLDVGSARPWPPTPAKRQPGLTAG